MPLLLAHNLKFIFKFVCFKKKLYVENCTPRGLWPWQQLLWSRPRPSLLVPCPSHCARTYTYTWQTETETDRQAHEWFSHMHTRTHTHTANASDSARPLAQTRRGERAHTPCHPAHLLSLRFPKVKQFFLKKLNSNFFWEDLKILGFETEFRRQIKNWKLLLGWRRLVPSLGFGLTKQRYCQGGDNSIWLPALADSRKKGEESIFRSFSGTVKFMFIFGVALFHTVGWGGGRVNSVKRSTLGGALSFDRVYDSSSSPQVWNPTPL